MMIVQIIIILSIDIGLNINNYNYCIVNGYNDDNNDDNDIDDDYDATTLCQSAHFDICQQMSHL